jgi:hypothetical protein
MTKHSKPADTYHPWSTYIDAREEARRRGDRKVGTEHLILGLLREPVLAQALGCDLQTARDALDAMDHDALAAVGIGAAFNPIPVALPSPPRAVVLARANSALSESSVPGGSSRPACTSAPAGSLAAILQARRAGTCSVSARSRCGAGVGGMLAAGEKRVRARG